MLRLCFICWLIPFVCGASVDLTDFKKIINGHDVNIKEVPYQVAVVTRDFEQFCGGIILKPTVVLTAAHCVKDHDPYYIQYGATELKDERNLIESEQVVYHKDYDRPLIIFDIALIFLKSPIKFSAYARPAVLPTKPPATDTKCVVSGWGVTENWETSSHLKKVEVKVLDHEKCKETYGNIGHLNNQMVCAGFFEKTIGSCHGDSGGPLVGFDMELIGIVSWGFGCINQTYPAVYTDVYYFRHWIIDQIKDYYHSYDYHY